MREHSHIPLIDLFAGPGGLSEGFAAFRPRSGARRFEIALSIEMDHWAHQTLLLRSFFHQFRRGHVPTAYYRHLRGEISRAELHALYPEAAEQANGCSWRAELGAVASAEVDRRIRNAVKSSEDWVLCGGPPCQAFSVVGRSRTGGISDKDHRVYLYREYLRILAVHAPPVFIMENVKGLLSSSVNGAEIFQQMLNDLRSPSDVVATTRRRVSEVSDATYSIFSLVDPQRSDANYANSSGGFIVKAEDYGVPQCRHRVILLGVRDDFAISSIPTLRRHKVQIPVSRVLSGIPKVRSGLTSCTDEKDAWRAELAAVAVLPFMRSRRNGAERLIRDRIHAVLGRERGFGAGRGAEFLACTATIDYLPDWYLDPALGGLCNHSTRPHMSSDLHRYLFAAAYSKVHGRSPELKDFPPELHPDHKNLNAALKIGHFDDRFRVQIFNRPATTITSHIAKDGHYFIHFDEAQCRSLTVREAARIQTFPDNYFFCGPRTHQYRQVGNAVPPLLAKQIAGVVSRILNPSGRCHPAATFMRPELTVSDG